MPSGRWASSNRRAELPADWPKIRARVLNRDGHRCVEPGCVEPATDVDHIRDRHDHRDANLQSLCADHHKAKTAREAVAARAQRSERARRPTEPHPGLVEPERGGG